ncbi:hypothetical protein K469DRAFT_726351 [Zopfia rhizophila CBS 207.26]|uniref:FabD/lysophospholipase-like protein n=1 Tax=Zopfia rhizophila CBS 207.26 TaxID=1314779 RepID=A0A6A6E5Q9_9PEZI|nr:hypothetical protein K469DRAFT_726351 [Zopfia rhizophila CBS 207.26]
MSGRSALAPSFSSPPLARPVLRPSFPGVGPRRTRQAANLASVKPCEIFDLIGGTSTRGMPIAIMLSRLEMDVDECISAYNKLIKAVFEEKSSWPPVSWTGKTKAQFDSKRLKSAVEEVIRNKGASTVGAWNDGKLRGCRTFVCTVAKGTAGIARLRSYAVPDERDIPVTICETALATFAATGFFDAAANIWCSRTGDLKPLVKCFVSIGTGNPGKKAIEDNMLKFLSKTLVGIATETEDTERKFVARWANHFDEKCYFRFNVDQGLQEEGLAEYKEQGGKSRVRNCVQNLREKQSVYIEDFT